MLQTKLDCFYVSQSNLVRRYLQYVAPGGFNQDDVQVIGLTL